MKIISSTLTRLLHLDIVHLELGPKQVGYLIGKNSSQKHLGNRATEALIEADLVARMSQVSFSYDGLAPT